MLAHEFIRNALARRHVHRARVRAVGYFVVLRAQVFAGDALSHVAFTGAVAAAAAGVDPRVGLFAATIAVALLLGVASVAARAPTTSRSGSCSPGCSASGCFFLDLFITGSGAATGCSGRARCSGRSSG